MNFSSSTAAAALASAPAFAAMGPNDKFDLVIKGGDVLDPSQNLRGKRDIGIRYGMIEAVEADIPAARAERLLDVSGKLVTPGLVDLHSHVFPYGSAIGIPADELVAHQCTTTCVSGGDAGANNFAAFRRYRGPDAHAALRLRPHRQYRADAVPGRRALQHRFRAGRRLRAGDRRERRHRARRQGAHVGERDRQARPRPLRGDAIYSGAPNIAASPIVQDECRRARSEAARRHFDVGHGGGCSTTRGEAAIQQGAPPDTISSDIHVFSGNSPGMPYLTWVMSKFMGLGFTLEQVVTMATTNPAKVINRMPKLGTLQVGAPGDVAIMELVEGPVSFVDTRNNRRDGKASSQAGADRDRRRAVRPAVQFAVRGAGELSTAGHPEASTSRLLSAVGAC